MPDQKKYAKKTASYPDLNLFRAVEVFMAVAEMQQVTTAAMPLV